LIKINLGHKNYPILSIIICGVECASIDKKYGFPVILFTIVYSVSKYASSLGKSDLLYLK
jgi:hypothetical protein